MMLTDNYGRTATDLRVSLTDRCNLRCTYCMPAEGLEWLPPPDLLSDDEIVRLVRIGATWHGIRSVRFTGGEPLLRRGLVDVVRRVREFGPELDLSLTTNGVGLARVAEALARAGLDRVNVSLDSIRPDSFETLTLRNRLKDVLDGLEAADQAGLGPIKVNAVLIRGINDDQAPELLSWAMYHGYQLRFIEQMPLDAQHQWDRSQMVTADETLSSLRAHYALAPATEERGNTPAERFVVAEGPHTVGVIASVTRPFCGACNRVRLTADGQIRNCLFAREESDLRAMLRGGASDESIAQRWARAMAGKLPGHGINDPTFLQPHRPMSAIGG